MLTGSYLKLLCFVFFFSYEIAIAMVIPHTQERQSAGLTTQLPMEKELFTQSSTLLLGRQVRKNSYELQYLQLFKNSIS